MPSILKLPIAEKHPRPACFFKLVNHAALPALLRAVGPPAEAFGMGEASARAACALAFVIAKPILKPGHPEPWQS
ncbi:hypothetical protein [Mesorhizobium sp.]|uniref:hypothetical protein n=1 Tax=Mesorhizobium sp. TaxID=1871066 RepID=UPI002579FA6F|nr:hypothetical protein [Mesorhizobium sp.]